MQEASQEEPGGMMAVLGIDFGLLETICSETGVEIANVNCPGQIVISGSKRDLGRASEQAQSKGAQRVLPLEVSGAFHSRWMRSAHDGLKHALEKCSFQPLEIPLVANVTALEIRDVAAVEEELLAQLCDSVQWQGSVEHMAAIGVSTFIEIGPGQVLTGLIRRTSKEAITQNIGSAEDISRWPI